jgi:hypothetical protein
LHSTSACLSASCCCCCCPPTPACNILASEWYTRGAASSSPMVSIQIPIFDFKTGIPFLWYISCC